MRQLTISNSITPRDFSSLNRYLREVDKIEMISPQEEANLAGKIRQGDHAALQLLTKANLRFVISVAKQYKNQGLSLGDLINEGNLGLIIAAQRYDETRGFKFISYAVWWIRQSIIASISEHSRIVRLPCSKLSQLGKVYKAYSKLEQEFGRKPSFEEIGTYLNIEPDKVSELLAVNDHMVLSIDEPYGQDEDQILMDTLPQEYMPADSKLVGESITYEIKRSLEILNSRDREILTLYFGLEAFSPWPLEEIAKKFKITKEHVGRLKARALQKIRKCSLSHNLKSCLN
jgi:RNA polymerase primary sigma factor